MVLKRKKEAVEHNSRSGSSRMDVPFEDELNKIASFDDSIQTDVLGSAKGIKSLKPTQTNSTAGPSAIPSTSGTSKKRKTCKDTLKEIHKEKENSRERCHKKKLDLFREIFSSNK
ncbi:unnamed protein product [Psylliodes chrysocephalus]|uniref:Uncharacterized protein n=1 Tax=Psylliodes chrysocephalus TaxID=3402493 RepID=A0A9P0GNW4_9CUCU|nr:unnamed protein product [Psylliodes chrysocephala]